MIYRPDACGLDCQTTLSRSCGRGLGWRRQSRKRAQFNIQRFVRPLFLRRNAFDGLRAWPSRLSGRAVQFDGIGDDADDATAPGALELRVAGRGVFADEKSAA